MHGSSCDLTTRDAGCPAPHPRREPQLAGCGDDRAIAEAPQGPSRAAPARGRLHLGIRGGHGLLRRPGRLDLRRGAAPPGSGPGPDPHGHSRGRSRRGCGPPLVGAHGSRSLRDPGGADPRHQLHDGRQGRCPDEHPGLLRADDRAVHRHPVQALRPLGRSAGHASQRARSLDSPRPARALRAGHRGDLGDRGSGPAQRAQRPGSRPPAAAGGLAAHGRAGDLPGRLGRVLHVVLPLGRPRISAPPLQRLDDGGA